MLVIDASVVVAALTTTRAAALVHELLSDEQTLHAPDLIQLEVAQALRKLLVSGVIEEEIARNAFGQFLDLPLTTYPHGALMRRVWELRHNMTAYDAAYVALAEALRAPLYTSDTRLAKSAGHRAKIRVL